MLAPALPGRRTDRRFLPLNRSRARLEIMTDAADADRIRTEAGFRDDGTRRGHFVRCSCGWESELCGTAVLAEAGAEQHVELHRQGRARRAKY